MAGSFDEFRGPANDSLSTGSLTNPDNSASSANDVNNQADTVNSANHFFGNQAVNFSNEACTPANELPAANDSNATNYTDWFDFNLATQADTFKFGSNVGNHAPGTVTVNFGNDLNDQAVNSLNTPNSNPNFTPDFNKGKDFISG